MIDLFRNIHIMNEKLVYVPVCVPVPMPGLKKLLGRCLIWRSRLGFDHEIID